MTHAKTQKPIISEPSNNTVARVLVTPTNSNKWKGCIYFSAYDLTGTILMYLSDIKKDYSGTFHKTPIYAFTAKDKTSIETKISERLQSILKNKK